MVRWPFFTQLTNWADSATALLDPYSPITTVMQKTVTYLFVNLSRKGFNIHDIIYSAVTHVALLYFTFVIETYFLVFT